MKKILFFCLLLFLFMPNTFAYYQAPVDIINMDVYELQDAVDKGYLTYELITRLYLDRIAAYDNKYNAVIRINKDAINEAKQKDVQYKKNGRDSILFGMPVVVKDNIDVYGMPTTAGFVGLEDAYPSDDAAIIKNLKAKGMIVIAKTNMSEFAFMASSSSSSYGITKNAYNNLYSSYGSSGGTAVAITLNYAPFGIGTDTNLSLRSPASASGIIGFRPTFDLVSQDGIIAYDVTKDTAGPMTKTVIENALLLEALTNSETGTYSSLDSSFKGKKIGVINQFLYGDKSLGVYGTGSTYKGIITLMEDQIKKMKDAGAEIIYLDDVYNMSWDNTYDKTASGFSICYAFNNWIKTTTSKIKNFNELASTPGHTYSLYDYQSPCTFPNIKAVEEEKSTVRAYVNNIYQTNNLDVLIYPTTKNELTKIGGDNFEASGWTISSLLGFPSVSMPLGLYNDLPYGIEFVMQKDKDKELYNLMMAYEKLNNNYVLPKDAPSLYEIPSEVTKLIKLYEENYDKSLSYIFKTKEITDYQQSLRDIKDFFINYNDYEDKISFANTLYNKYETAIYEVDKVNNIYIVIYIIAIVVLFFFIKTFFPKNNKKKKKHVIINS